MSVRVSTYVWQIKLAPSQKLVMLALADHCHDDGSEARPSQPTIIAKTGLSEQSVRRALTSLLREGYIQLDRPASQHRANCYVILVPDGFATLRGAKVEPLAPRGAKSESRGAKSTPPEVPPRHPNHKEPSLEPTALSVSEQVAEAKRRLRGRP